MRYIILYKSEGRGPYSFSGLTFSEEQAKALLAVLRIIYKDVGPVEFYASNVDAIYPYIESERENW